MLQDTKRTRRMLGASAGTTLAIALAVLVGANPAQGHDTGPSSTAAAGLHAPAPVSDADEEAAPAIVAAPVAEDAAPQPEAAPAPSADPAPEAGLASAPQPVTGEAAPPPPGAPAPSAAPAAAPAPPPPPVADPVVPRRQPSPAEVQQALDGLEPYVDSIFSPSAAQVAEAGEKVCTAFDEGQTFAQVKATAQELVSKVPLTTVRPGADDYVVRTVVRLYCPGHQVKLV